MKIAILRERFAGELRVAATPETVGKYVGLGAEVTVEAGAGAGARIADAQFAEAGATIAATAEMAVKGASIILVVRRPEAGLLKGAAKGALVIGALDPYGNEADIAALAKAGVATVAMEFMPRITRAQVMDVLSSQANLAGYQAVIEAAAAFDRALPMMMTAAGTVRPAKAFVMGAGVAGLQAIATAKRLGAVVSATDVRAAAGEQIESLGAKFIMTDALKDASGEGGYARELTAEEQAAQGELVASHIAKQDIVITTALIPGRPAPKLVTRAMVDSMAPGSVIVDLAAERGGNVELTQPGKTIVHNGVTVIGLTNFAGRIPTTASQLYARNLLAFVETLVDKATRTVAVNWDDDLVKATVLTRDGKVVHPAFTAAAPARKPAPKPEAGRAAPARKARAAAGSATQSAQKSVNAKAADKPIKTGSAGLPARSRSSASAEAGKSAKAAAKPKDVAASPASAAAKAAPAKTGASTKAAVPAEPAKTTQAKPAAGASRKPAAKPPSGDAPQKPRTRARKKPETPEGGE